MGPSRSSRRAAAAVRVLAAGASCVLACLSAVTLTGAGCAARPAGTASSPQGQGQPQPPRQQSATTPPRSNIPDAAVSPTGSPSAPISATDPCATRLHDLCGPLLFYYAVNRQLPATLDELQALATPDPLPPRQCPVSRRPYVYVPEGIAWGDRGGFIVLHDAEPSHSGHRWAVVVEEPKRMQDPLITRVVAVAEPLFLGRPAPPREAAEGQAE